METPKERAKILFDKMLELNDEATSTEMMVEFAKNETAQLQADKEELIEMLKECELAFDKIGHGIIEYKIKSLIQKMKQ